MPSAPIHSDVCTDPPATNWDDAFQCDVAIRDQQRMIRSDGLAVDISIAIWACRLMIQSEQGRQLI